MNQLAPVIASQAIVALVAAGKDIPLPIRLLPTPTKCGVRPFPGVKPVKGRRDRPTRDSEQRAECVEGIEASVESKRELVEVGL